MATRSFDLRTQPHEAVIGDTTLLFRPEVLGAEFLDSYERLKEVQQAAKGSGDDGDAIDAGLARQVTAAIRQFLAELMVPEAVLRFNRWDVMDGSGAPVESFTTAEEAQKRAAAVKGSEVIDRSLQLPDRLLAELIEWTAELYGSSGGDQARPTGSSSASPRPSRRAGTPGRGTSRSRG